MKTIKINSRSEIMNKMKSEAIKEAKDFKSKSKLPDDLKIKNENKISKSQKRMNLFEIIKNDNDAVLIILLIVILMDDEKNFSLLLVLVYILI